jgi:hypothetical protein
MPPPIQLRLRWLLAAPALFVGAGLLCGTLAALLFSGTSGLSVAGLMAAILAGSFWILAAIGLWKGQSGLALVGMVCALAAGISSNLLLAL